jgi:amino acid transporter
MASMKRVLIGRPIATDQAHHEKIPKIIALPVFASDALSSVAYATEAIMGALLVAGTGTFGLTPWLSLGIIVLLAIVATSYRQTIMAYPSGGGSYIVSRENLGELPAQIAGASLLVDYVLTVSVSVAAGVAAVASLLQNQGRTMTQTEIVVVCIACIAFIALLNLRGLRESGSVFAVPTYSFIAIMYLMIGLGLWKIFGAHALPSIHPLADFQNAGGGAEGGPISHHVNGFGGLTRFLGLYLILHAFASGCTALTGVEAISNGVPAFKEPSSKNAATTMLWMAGILGTLFLGLSYLAMQIHALPPNAILSGHQEALGETVLSQVGRAVFDNTTPVGNILYWILQIATALILILAANTSFADFPRLSSIIARDGFMPRQFANIGDKLVFDRGIAVLALFSTVLIVVFRGRVDSLIPLYAIGVFLSFTLSQAGMVKHWFSLKTPGWKSKALVNGTGAVATAIVTLIFAAVKFAYGAWIVIILIPLLVFFFLRVKKHYRSVAKQLSLEGYRPAQGLRHHVLVLAPGIHRGVIPALQYARTISSDARAIHVAVDPTREARLRKRWTQWSRGMPLVVLPSPYRSLGSPIIEYIDRLQAQEPNSLTTVVIPEFVPSGWFATLLHGQASLTLKVRLLFKRGVIVTSVPYHIEAYVPLANEIYPSAEHVASAVPTEDELKAIEQVENEAAKETTASHA